VDQHTVAEFYTILYKTNNKIYNETKLSTCYTCQSALSGQSSQTSLLRQSVCHIPRIPRIGADATIHRK